MTDAPEPEAEAIGLKEYWDGKRKRVSGGEAHPPETALSHFPISHADPFGVPAAVRVMICFFVSGCLIY